jgi:hypothetical protein
MMAERRDDFPHPTGPRIIVNEPFPKKNNTIKKKKDK